MRKQLLCGVSVVAVIVAVNATAFAADVPVKKAPPPAAARLLDWSGFYVGGHLGYGQAKITGDWNGDLGQDQPLTRNLSGIVGGMHAGRNWQVNTFVYGWEADLSATGWSASVAKSDLAPPTDVAGLYTKVAALASLRARLGVLFTPNFLGYVTGGLAYAHGEARAHTVSTVFELSQQNQKFHALGGVLGLGAEWKQTQNLSWRVEGLWYPLSKSRQFTIEDTGTVKLDDIWVVRLGATYHFDGSGLGKAPVAVPAGLPVKGIAPGQLPLLTWTGPYIGGHLGYGKAKITGDWDGGADQDITKDLSGIVGGMHAGQNWQVNTFVYGWEADLSASGLSNNVVKLEPGGADTLGALHTKVTALASLRARLGMLFTPNFHGYVTGGLAYAHGEARAHAVSTDGGPLTFDPQQRQRFSKWGSVLGLGAEWKQTPNFSWRLEGLWYRLNDSKIFTPGNTGTVKLDDAWVVRLGATYHFDSSGWGKAPVVAARY